MVDLASACVQRDGLSALLAQFAHLSGVRGETQAGNAAGFEQITDIAAHYRVSAKPVTMRVANLTEDLRRACPILLDLGGRDYLLVRRVTGRRIDALSREGRKVSVALADVVDRLQAVNSPPEDALPAASAAAADNGLSERVAALLRQERERQTLAEVGWLLDADRNESAALRGLLLEKSTLLHAFAIVVCHLGQFLLWVMSWLVLGTVLLGVGAQERWFGVWLLCLSGVVVLTVATRWLSGTLVLTLGTRIKQRVLAAIMNLSASEVRRAGLGRMIAATIDANRFDALAINGGTMMLLSVVELAVLFALLLVVPVYALAGLLAVFLIALMVLGIRFLSAHQRWHRASVDVTAVHTEEMIGHRARKTLLGMSRWYQSEDAVIAGYASAARDMDAQQLLLTVLPRIWLLLGAAFVIFASFVATDLAETTLVAVIGLLLLGYATLRRAADGMAQTVGALVSYRHLVEVMQVNQALVNPAPAAIVEPFTAGAGPHELLAQDLKYRYPDAAEPVLDGVTLRIRPHERFVLEGRSGGGKSTLANVLTGRLPADHGSVLLGGLDAHVLGLDCWRRNICYVPQFHNNHVLTETFLFNLLLGCAWPPTRELMARLQAVVQAVGLGALVARMPAGLLQMVGESGWRMSQGEQARLFVARGILQSPQLLIVDEPLSALDPDTSVDMLAALEACDCMQIMIAHR